MREEVRAWVSAGAVAAFLAAAVLLAPIPLAAQNDPAAGGKKPVPLINVNDEMGDYLNRAKDLIAEKRFDEAIEYLQAMLGKTEQCFVATPDGRLFVPLSDKVNEVIGSMPPEGLKLYRRLHDAQADSLYRKSAEAMSEVGLNDVAHRFFHTASGEQAVNLLGAILFDRGEHAQAANWWRALLDKYKDGTLSRPMLLAKTAVALHLCGDDAAANKLSAELAEKYKDARISAAGQEEPALAYVQRMLALPAPAAGALAPMGDNWTSVAGSPDSMAVMKPCRPVLDPRWTAPDVKLEDNPNVKYLLPSLTGPGKVSMNIQIIGQGGGGQMIFRAGTGDGNETKLELAQGQLLLAGRDAGNPNRKISLPIAPSFHPVLVGKVLLYRSVEGVIAHDLLTGKKLWDTIDLLPMYQASQAINGRQFGYNGMPIVLSEDAGQFTLTVGGDKVFAVGKFYPARQRMFSMMNGQPDTMPDTSVLAAFSLTGQLKLKWRTEDEGFPDMIRAGKFLCAPTYSRGNLFSIMQYSQAYHLVCQNADTGAVRWTTLISQCPTRQQNYPFANQQEIGSPPAVADGKVLVATNAGVIACFDAQTGRGLWAYQYDSNNDMSQQEMAMKMAQAGRGGGQAGLPFNPLLVTRGLVVALPADSPKLIALRVDTGSLAWEVSRQAQRYLATIDEGRLLLSSPHMFAVECATGKQVWAAQGVDNVYGRPAITSDAILASGKGELIPVSLPDLALRNRSPLRSNTGVLGNLVSAGGKLIAANAAGVSAYFDFDEAQRELTARLESASGEAAAELLLQRGLNCFNAEKPQLTPALEDMLKAKGIIDGLGEATKIEPRLRQAMFRVYVAMANEAADNTVMLENLEKAQPLAYSDRARCEMLVRMIKYNRRVGKYAQAAELAQKLSAEQVKLLDVEIGAAAEPFVRDDDPDAALLSAYDLGHKLIKELIDEHGRSCYAAFDQQALGDLDAAIKDDNPETMIRVWQAYRHSTSGPMALLRAGESYYRRAFKLDATARRNALISALQHLSRVGREYPDSGLAASAALGLAMVYQEMSPRLVWRAVQTLATVPPDSQVAFAGVSGTVDQLLARPEWKNVKTPQSSGPPPSSLKPKLELAYENESGGILCRDDDGKVLVIAGAVLVLEEGKFSLFDPATRSYRWQTPVPVDRRMLQFGGYGWAMLMGGLASDKSVVAMASRAGHFGLEVKTGKLIWNRGQGEAVVNELQMMSVGDDSLAIETHSGALYIVDLKTGKDLWAGYRPQAIGWRTPPQLSGGMALVNHGNMPWQMSVLDVAAKKLVGTLTLASNPNEGVWAQSFMTNDGLVVTCDRQNLRLIEPLTGIDQPIWSVPMTTNQPYMLGLTDSLVMLSPSANSGTLELRSMADGGKVWRTLKMETISGRPAVPFAAYVAGDMLYVLGASDASNVRSNPMINRMPYVSNPSLHAFELATGKFKWAVDLGVPGGQSYMGLTTPEICRDHIAIMVKPQPFARPNLTYIIDTATGKIVDKLEVALGPLPGIQPGQGPNAQARIQAQIQAQQAMQMRQSVMASPAIVGANVVIETAKGIAVYGQPSDEERQRIKDRKAEQEKKPAAAPDPAVEDKQRQAATAKQAEINKLKKEVLVERIATINQRLEELNKQTGEQVEAEKKKLSAELDVRKGLLKELEKKLAGQ